jgi:Bacterial transcriptional regulator
MALLVCETQSCDIRRLKNTAPLSTNGGIQRAAKAPSDRYRIHVIDRAAQILDCFGFDHQELSVSEIGVKTVGRRIPTYCTSLGKAMLACLGDQEIRNILRVQVLRPYTANTVKTLSQLLTDLRAVRKRGYAVGNEEIEIGLRCVGAPIKDYSSAMVGAISVAAPSARLASPKISAVGRLVVATAEEISEKLGYENPIKAKAE